MAYQILEDNYAEDEIHLVGIASGGEILAKEIKKQIVKISKIDNIEVVVFSI